MSFQGWVLALAQAHDYKGACDLLQTTNVPSDVKRDILRLFIEDWRNRSLYATQQTQQDCSAFVELLAREISPQCSAEDPYLFAHLKAFAIALIVYDQHPQRDLNLFAPIFRTPGILHNEKRLLHVVLTGYPRSHAEQSDRIALTNMWQHACEGIRWDDLATLHELKGFLMLQQGFSRWGYGAQKHLFLRWMLLHMPRPTRELPAVNTFLLTNSTMKVYRTYRALGLGSTPYAGKDPEFSCPHHRWVWLVLLRGGGKNCGGLSGGKGMTAGERELILRLLKPWFGDYLTDAKDLTL